VRWGDGTGSSASFYYPAGIAYDDSTSTTYVADTYNCRVRTVSSAGVVGTLAGSGVNTFKDSTALDAAFSLPAAVAVAPGGARVYIADSGNNVVRVYSVSTGTVVTLAGNVSASGLVDGAAASARFFSPAGLALDSTAGTLYVADTRNNAIRAVAVATGAVSTLAGGAGLAASGFSDGTGTAATFSSPVGLAVLPGVAVYVGDGGNNALRRIALPSAAVDTLAGGGPGAPGWVDGTGTAGSRFYSPGGVSVDSSGVGVWLLLTASTAPLG